MSREKVLKMKENRFDMSDFLIHFTHSNNDHNAFNVLLQIIEDGFIKFGWAIRGNERTIYGNNEAVCFTEMPLLNFWQYSDNRDDEALISPYGIAIPKNRMFSLGARNMIYGTTDNFEKEIISGEVNLKNYPMPNELYRYIMTDLLGYKDWIHEREWRWSDSQKLSKHSGLPIWILNEPNVSITEYYFGFDPIIVIVKTNEEVDEVKHKLNSLLSNDEKNIYNHIAIRQTKIISKENIINLNTTIPPQINGLQWANLNFDSIIRNNYFTTI